MSDISNAPRAETDKQYAEELQQWSETIALMDPLNADLVLDRLPRMNERGEINLLVTETKRLLSSSVIKVESFNVFEATAALRDLGFLMASMRRHGFEPIETIPQLEPIVVTLGQISSMVPRETIYHYGPWNPDGKRERRFTTLPDEADLIASVRIAMPAVINAIEYLAHAWYLSPVEPDFAVSCKQASDCLANNLIHSIAHAIKGVRPDIFSLNIRPFFEPIKVQGKSYTGIAGGDIPLYMIDHLLWHSDNANAIYSKFIHQNVQYAVPRLRKLYSTTDRQTSLVTRVYDALTNLDTDSRSTVMSAVDALDKLFVTLIRFRGAHTRFAYRGFAFRDENAIGTSGYRPSMLDHLLVLTRQAQTKLKRQLHN